MELLSIYPLLIYLHSFLKHKIHQEDIAMTLSILGRSVASLVANNLPTANSQTLIKDARKILDNAIDRALSGQLNKDLGQSKRALVTNRTYNRLQKIIPKRMDIGKVHPYQEFAHCDKQAHDIMHAQVTEALQATSSSSPQTEETFLTKLWNQVKSVMTGRSETEGLPSDAEGLLSKFNERGILTLRAPRLSENHDDHAVVVFSVSKINVPGKGPKIVVGMIDCNDLAIDSETKASWETAAKLGKSHPSKLTHEEADKNGAHLRRIRFVDGDALIKNIRNYSEHSAILILQERMGSPKITFPKEKIPPLTLDEAEKLSKILVEIYDTPEVEKFENQSLSHPEHHADAGRGKGRAMSQQLYKAMMKKD